jgi:hypothetical protein
MLTNRVQLCLLNKTEIELFEACEGSSIEWYDYGTGRWTQSLCDIRNGELTYRLKLKEGEWYKYGSTIVNLKSNNLFFPNGSLHVSTSNISDTLDFRPATQEEIDSVKPKERHVDVEIDWGDGDPCVKNNISKVNMRGWSIGDQISHLGYLSTYYRVQDGEEIWMKEAIEFTYDYTRVLEKATHARFVKL